MHIEITLKWIQSDISTIDPRPVASAEQICRATICIKLHNPMISQRQPINLEHSKRLYLRDKFG